MAEYKLTQSTKSVIFNSNSAKKVSFQGNQIWPSPNAIPYIDSLTIFHTKRDGTVINHVFNFKNKVFNFEDQNAPNPYSGTIQLSDDGHYLMLTALNIGGYDNEVGCEVCDQHFTKGVPTIWQNLPIYARVTDLYGRYYSKEICTYNRSQGGEYWSISEP